MRAKLKFLICVHLIFKSCSMRSFVEKLSFGVPFLCFYSVNFRIAVTKKMMEYVV